MLRAKKHISRREISLGLYLKILRRSRGLTLANVQEATKKLVSSPYLNMIENGKVTKPSLIFLEELSYLYGTPIDDLLYLAGHSNARSTATDLTLADLDVSPEEEAALINYLQVIRKRLG